MHSFISWSGGKDAALSLYKALKINNVHLNCLLNMISEDGRHSRTHGISSALLRKQAQALGLPIYQRETSWDNYENEFKTVVEQLKAKGVTHGIFGDIDIAEHRDWVERVCKDININSIFPIWQENRYKILSEFIDLGFKAIIVSTRAEKMDESWLGREINNTLVSDLEKLNDIDLCGEAGEYHTFVYDGPIFRSPVSFHLDKKIKQEDHWILTLS